MNLSQHLLEIVLIALLFAQPLVGLCMGAVDLVIRAHGFRVGFWLVAALGALWLVLLHDLVWSTAWEDLPFALHRIGMPMVPLAMLCAGALLGLSLSRALRPEGLAQWRPIRISVALCSGALMSGVCIGYGREDDLRLLVFLCACAPAIFAFGRTGTPRLEQGAGAAMGLVVLLAAALGTLTLTEGASSAVSGILYGYPIGRGRGLGIVLGLRWLAAIGWALIALGRRERESAHALWGFLPIIGVAAVAVLRVSICKNPGATAAAVPVLRDLSGAPFERTDLPIPNPALVCAPSDARRDCASWMAPDLALSEAPIGGWIAAVELRAPLRDLGFRYVGVDTGASYSHLLLIDEREGEAWVSEFLQPPGEPAPRNSWLRGYFGLPLGKDLTAAINEAFLLTRAGKPTTLRIEIERSPRWTIQDATSICASLVWPNAVQCLLASP